MVQPCSVTDRDQVVDTMIAVTHLSNVHRTIIAGDGAMELYLSLRRRGFVQVATTATCRVPRRQHGIGLLTAKKSLAAFESTLLEVSQFLSANATIAILIESREGEFCLSIRRRLEQMGFRIEAGVRCQRGLVLAAHREGFAQMERAA
jgi:hypothetical protein